MRSRRSSPIEPLEARIAPATLIWDGSAGDEDWFNSLNWDQNVVPGAADTAILAISSTINLSAAATVAAFQQSAGTFTSGANVTLTISAQFDWTGGTQSGAGTTTVAAGATFTYPANGNTTVLNQRTLNLNGNTTVAGSFTNDFGLTGGATVNNGGVFDIQSGISFTGGPATFNNLTGATFKTSAGGGSALFQLGIDFNNTGLVQSQSGTIGFRGYTQTAGQTELNGGGFSFSPAPNLNGGVLSGSGTITGNVINNGTIIRPGGAGAIGTITTNGDYTQGAGGTVETELAGTGAGQFDVFAPGGVAIISGTLTAPLLGGFVPPAGSQFAVFTAGNVSGTFTTPPGNVGIQYAFQSVTLLGPVAPLETVVTTEMDVVNANDGVVSLREAITFANSNAGLDTITFNIPGAAGGVRTITPTSLLPAITDAVVIDGYSQPGASVNTLAQGSNAVPTVELSGPGAGGRGLQIDADNSLVRGLIINRFNNAPAIVLNGDGNRVEGCFIGTDSTGTADFPGVSREGLNISGTGNIIGGTTPETRNVVSGHTFTGINIIGASGVGNNRVQGNLIGVDKTGTSALGNGTGVVINGLTGNTIGGPTAAARNVISSNNAGINIVSGSNTVQGNFIGVDVTGAADLGNSGTGIFMQGAAGNLIGGLTATAGQGAGNVISGNGSFGIDVNGNAAPGHIIQGNLIGTDATGTSSIANSNGGINIRNAGGGNLVGDTNVQGRNVISGNGQHGLLLENGTNRLLNNYIGVGLDGTSNLGNAQSGVFINSQDSNALIGNVIAFNGGDGLGVNFFGSGTGNAFVSNSIFANGDLGIDLGHDGVTPNDALDADSGANRLQNFPVLTSAMSGSGATSISGTFNSTPNASFQIEFYASVAADPSGFGEGQILLGFTNVTTDASGNAPISFSPAAQLPAGSQITATATDAGGNTSEFSAALLAQISSSPGGRSVTVTDVDGDLVSIEVNKGSIPPGAIIMGPNGVQLIDLRAAGNGLAKATLTIDAQQIGSGDGVVNVGAINATGINLLKIRVDGDLGQIDIGAGDARKPALKSLVVGSLGAKGATTQPLGTQNPLLSEVKGALGKLTVGLDVQNAVVEVSGKLGKVLIGGDLIDSGAPAPLTQTPGSIGVFLNGGIPPANASHAGAIFAPNIGSVTVMGDVNGGEISAEAQIKNVKIVGKLMSDDPLDPAILRVGERIEQVLIKGDAKNALILAGYNRGLEPRTPDATIGKVTVKGNWSASSVVAGVSDPTDNGFGINDMIIAGDTTPDVLSKIARVIIKGTATGSATLTDHSAITAQKIAALRILGARIPLATGPDNLLLDPLSQNFRAVEL